MAKPAAKSNTVDWAYPHQPCCRMKPFIFRADHVECLVRNSIMASHPQLPSMSRRRPQRPCWECRRRRLVCDFSLPECNKCRAAGVDCPGYGEKKPLKWLTPGKVRSRNRQRKLSSPGKKDVAASTRDSSASSSSCPSDEEIQERPMMLHQTGHLGIPKDQLSVHEVNMEARAIVQAVQYCGLTFFHPGSGI